MNYEGLTKKYAEKSQMLEEEVKQKREDYSIPVLKSKYYYYNPMVFLYHMDKALCSNILAVELLEVQRRVMSMIKYLVVR